MAAKRFGELKQKNSGVNPRVLIAVTAGGLAVVSALLAVVIFSSGPAASSAPAAVVVKEEPEIRMVDVLVPVEDIEAGQPLEAAMFRRESRPQIAVDSRTIRDLEEIQGHFARSLIVRGSPLIRDLITSVRPTNQITANIPDGHRAVTISVDAKSSVEGWVRPGARVDVLWIGRIGNQAGITTIVQNARVLSAERSLQSNPQPGQPTPSTVTLLVTDDDAPKIQLAQTTGSLSLSLRGDNDSGQATGGSSMTLEGLYGSNRAPVREERNVQGRVRIPGKDGQVEEFILKDGRLVPANQP